MLLLSFQDFLEWQWFSSFHNQGKRRPGRKELGFPPSPDVLHFCRPAKPRLPSPPEEEGTSCVPSRSPKTDKASTDQGGGRVHTWRLKADLASTLREEHTLLLNHHWVRVTRDLPIAWLKTRKTKRSDQTPPEEPKEPTCIRGKWFSYTTRGKHNESLLATSNSPQCAWKFL